jgi:hypothetical protein
MEKTEPNIEIEKVKEEETPEFFLDRLFDEEEHFAKLKNKSSYLLDNQNENTFKTIHFFYDAACKERENENKTFPEKKIDKIIWSSNLKEEIYCKTY